MKEDQSTQDQMILSDHVQGSPEWLEWRSQGVTATDIPVILGLSPYKTVWQLWAEKIGRINSPDISRNPNVIRGNKLEDKARQLAEKQNGEILLPICGEYAQWQTLRASFDGLDGSQIPHEFKAPSEKTWTEILRNGTDSPTYKLYESQVHAQCVVAGQSLGKLIFFVEDDANPDGIEKTFEVELSDSMRDHIIAKAEWFWNLVSTETPPEKDPERDCFIPEDGEKRFLWEAQADAWRQNHLKAKQLKAQLEQIAVSQKEIQSEMLTLMGEFKNTDVSGVKISRFIKKGSVDYQSFLKEYFPKLDIDALTDDYRKPGRSECRFTLSEDELVNMEAKEVITSVKPGYF
jgi:putative phage-type endonuclease